MRRASALPSRGIPRDPLLPECPRSLRSLRSRFSTMTASRVLVPRTNRRKSRREEASRCASPLLRCACRRLLLHLSLLCSTWKRTRYRRRRRSSGMPSFHLSRSFFPFFFSHRLTLPSDALLTFTLPLGGLSASILHHKQ